MELPELLTAFYQKAIDDNRLSPVHLSLYFALLHEAIGQPSGFFIFLRGDVIMQKAKISSRVTYHRCIRALHEYGYVEYRPSNTPGCSTLRLNEIG